jgi:uroporphyrinogen decarboxylase
MSALAREKEARLLLGIDIVNIHEFPTKLLRYDTDGFPIYLSAFGDSFKDNGVSMHMVTPAFNDIEDESGYKTPDAGLCTTHALDYWRDNSDFYLFTQISGPVSALCWALGFEDAMCYCLSDTDEMVSLARKIMEFETARAKIFLDRGADAIMMADDVAFNHGLFLPPAQMDAIAFPLYKEAVANIKKHRDVPVFFHSDGNIMDALPFIADCGFDGLHSIQPSAGMDIEKVAGLYGGRLCLMGNMDLDYLLTFGSPDEVKKEAERLTSLFKNGGFILSSCNILTNNVTPENALAMYGV